jgi:PAS domain S-box-containing protein
MSFSRLSGKNKFIFRGYLGGVMPVFPKFMKAILILTGLVLLIGGAGFYQNQKQRIEREVYSNLEAIANLKVEQIIKWREDILADASVVMESPFLSDAVERVIQKNEVIDIEKMKARLQSLQRHYHLNNLLLVDGTGEPRFSLNGRLTPIHQEARQKFSEAFAKRIPIMSDLHIPPGNGGPHLDIIAPLFKGISRSGAPIGAIIMQIDAQEFLYPLIQSWPVPSRTAEIELIRREGDTVLFLNELRHQKDTALRLRIPLDKNDAPAVLGALKKEGVLAGKDYRGVEVLSVIKHVPDSSWVIVAKIDTEEALSVSRRESILILLILLGLLTAFIASTAGLWQRQAKRLYRERFRAEEAGRKSEERYRVTLMSVGDGIIATDADGRVELMNPVAERLTGWNQSEALGRPLEEIFHIINEETRDPVENPVHQVIARKGRVGLANHTLLITREGKERPIADAGTPLFNEQGEISGVVLVFRDQSEERQKERTLRESQERYRLLAENVGDVIWVLDLEEGRFTYISPSVEKLRGYTAEEVMAQDMVGALTSESLGYLMNVLPGRLDEFTRGIHKDYTDQVAQPRKDGGTVWTECTTRYGRNQTTGHIEVYGVSRDITQRREAEAEINRLAAELEQRVRRRTAQLEAVNRELESFNYSVSHDLRAPLRHLTGFINLLEKHLSRGLDDKSRHYMQVISDAAVTMGKLIDDLLSFSRMGRAEMTRRPIDTERMVREIISAAEMNLNHRDIAWTIHPLNTVEGDPLLLKTVWTNLILNALKFTGRRDQALIEIGRRDDHGIEEVFYIRDNGVGFDMTYQHKLFGLFQRLHQKEEFEGTGLGLANVRRIITRHGGRTWAEGALGQGATFYFSLPKKY